MAAAVIVVAFVTGTIAIVLPSAVGTSPTIRGAIAVVAVVLVTPVGVGTLTVIPKVIRTAAGRGGRAGVGVAWAEAAKMWATTTVAWAGASARALVGGGSALLLPTGGCSSARDRQTRDNGLNIIEGCSDALRRLSEAVETRVDHCG